MNYDYDDENERGRGKGRKKHPRGHAHVDTLQIYRDGDWMVLVVDGEECRLPGGRANLTLEEDGRTLVGIFATICADKVEVGGSIGS